LGERAGSDTQKRLGRALLLWSSFNGKT